MKDSTRSNAHSAQVSTLFVGRTAKKMLLSFLAVVICHVATSAQETATATAPNTDKEVIRALLQRIDRLEARVTQLESEKVATAAPAHAASTTPAATAQTEPETEQQTPEHAERMDVSKTLLRIRGFGDMTLHGSDQKGDNTTFALGQLDLFVTSDISEKFKFLSEIVFEGGPENIFGNSTGEKNQFNIDVERYILQYSYNDYLNISAGRYHTAIGYYSTAYHHSTWLQTTTGRPLLFQFEDQGGLLPIHNVGVSVNGAIPSGHLGLHYVAEIGNGRSSRSPLSDEPVQNEIDENNHKAFNLAVFARPGAIQGLQVGFSAYNDLLTPAGQTPVGENIFDAYAVIVRSNFEWLNEALLIRHSPHGLGRSFNTPGFYTQISKRYKAYRPYFRYQYVNAANDEPIFPDIRLQHGPSLGIRFDASESVALKLQYDRVFKRDQPATNGLGLQVGFTF